MKYCSISADKVTSVYVYIESSFYILDTLLYVSNYLTFNCMVMDGLLTGYDGYDSTIKIFLIYYARTNYISTYI